MKNKAFTLIELLAVIIILGILMLIAIPSVTNYINNSRKSTYVNTIDSLIKGTIAKVNSGDLNVYDTDTTYYVPCTCIKLENGDAKSPYGKFDPAYVVVTFDGNNFHYYFTGKDVQNMGVPTLTSSDILSKESIVANVEAIDTTVGIEGTTNVYVFSDECNGEGETNAVGTTVPGGSSGSGSGGSTPSVSDKLCKRATTLHTATCTCTTWAGCKDAGYYDSGPMGTTTITYGNETTTTGVLNAGDAFDCDVNNDGTYDSETERFYYITTEDGKAVLAYYSNIDEDGNASILYNYAYASKEDISAVGKNCTSQYGCNWAGPVTISKYLPSKTKWSNPKIIAPGIRQITGDNGATTTCYGLYTLDPFNYKESAARLLTYQEVQAACGYSYPQTTGYMDGCNYLLENLESYEDYKGYGTSKSFGYWLESPDYRVTNIIWSVYAGGRDLTCNDTAANDATRVGLRPVIEVLLSNIEK